MQRICATESHIFSPKTLVMNCESVLKSNCLDGCCAKKVNAKKYLQWLPIVHIKTRVGTFENLRI